MIQRVSVSLMDRRFNSRAGGTNNNPTPSSTIVPAQIREINHQQLWKTPSAPSRSSAATRMLISLPATLPNPMFEKLRYAGTELTIIQSPYSGTLQK